MKPQVIAYRDIAQEKWDKLILSEFSNGEFINSRKYLSYHCSDKLIDHSVAVIDRDSLSLRSVFPAAAIPKDKSVAISHPGTTFAGIIFDTKQVLWEELDAHFELLLNYYRQNNLKKIELRLPPAIYYNQPREDLYFLLWKKGFKPSGYTLASVVNLRDLSSEEDLFINYLSKRRNQIKKSLKEDNFIFSKADTIEDYVWDSLANNLATRFKAKPTHSLKEINDLHSKFPDRIIPYIICDKNTKEYAASAVVYKFKKVFHTQYLDLNYKMSEKYPNLVLIHNLLLEAIKEKFSYFSLGPVTEHWGNLLNAGLFDYKNQFGAGSIVYYKFEKLL